MIQIFNTINAVLFSTFLILLVCQVWMWIENEWWRQRNICIYLFLLIVEFFLFGLFSESYDLHFQCNRNQFEDFFLEFSTQGLCLCGAMAHRLHFIFIRSHGFHDKLCWGVCNVSAIRLSRRAMLCTPNLSMPI